MDPLRKPFQGVINIVRFNWHFYVILIVTVLSGLLFARNFLQQYSALINILCFAALLISIVSLIVSYCVYDRSSLYTLSWLDNAGLDSTGIMININAGFDETSALLKKKYPAAVLSVYDFYDPSKHTEVSIKRARKAYPAYPSTVSIETNSLPLENASVNTIFVILSAHEIRNEEERICFFQELSRVTANPGRIVVTEHLRDLPNFLAYTIGFFHFHSRSTWLKTFSGAGLDVIQQSRITPFITTFILKKNAAAS